MEGTHGELGSRLADGLGSNDANGLTHVDQMPSGKVAAITLGANTAPALTGQHRTYFHLFQTRRFYFLNQCFIDFFVGSDQHITGNRVKDIIQRDPPQNPVSDVFDDLATLGEGRNNQTIQRAAIRLSNDGILGNVNKTSRQISGVGCFERGVGKTYGHRGWR